MTTAGCIIALSLSLIITILIDLIVLSLFLILLATLFSLLLFVSTTDNRRRRVVFGKFAFDIIQGLKVEGLKLDNFKV